MNTRESARLIDNQSTLTDAGDRSGFQLTVANNKLKGPILEYIDYDYCLNFAKVSSPEKMMTAIQVEKELLQLFRARRGGDPESMQSMAALHPVYGISSKMYKPMTRAQFGELVEAVFMRVLRNINAHELVQSNKDGSKFVLIRLPESSCQQLADWRKMPVQLDDSSSPSSKLFLPEEFQPPHVPFDKSFEDARLALQNSAIHRNRFLWRRYDRLSQPLPSNMLIGKEVVNHPEISIFRDTDRIRLLIDALQELCNVAYATDAKWIKRSYCLHQPASLDKIKLHWGGLTFANLVRMEVPLDLIRSYYGEEIAYYFGWLDYYTKQLIVPAILGLILFGLQLVLDPNHIHQNSLVNNFRILYCIFMAGWGAFFLQSWKQKEKILGLRWGIKDHGLGSNVSSISTMSPFFKPDGYDQDPIRPTELHPVMSPVMKFLRGTVGKSVLLVSTVVVVLSVNQDLSEAVWQELRIPTLINLANRTDSDSLSKTLVKFSMMYAVVNSLLMKAFDSLWTLFLAHWLTKRENHKYTDRFFQSYYFKVFFFKFATYFSALFYLAFFKEYYQPCDEALDGRCLGRLRTQLVALVFVGVTTNIKELVVPFATYIVNLLLKKRSLDTSNMTQPERESLLSPYTERKGTIKDWLDVIVHFGFTVLFSTVCPFLPALSIGLNLLTMRIDAYKLCYTMQRPMPRRIESLQVWNKIQSFMSFVAVLTNVSLCAFVTVGYNHSLTMKLFWTIMLSLLGLSMKELVEHATPEMSKRFKILEGRQAAAVSEALYGDTVKQLAEQPLAAL